MKARVLGNFLANNVLGKRGELLSDDDIAALGDLLYGLEGQGLIGVEADVVSVDQAQSPAPEPEKKVAKKKKAKE